MLYSIDDYKNLTPSEIVMGRMTNYTTVTVSDWDRIYFAEKEEAPLKKNCLYILNYSYQALQEESSTPYALSMNLYFTPATTTNIEMMCPYACLSSYTSGEYRYPRATFTLNYGNYVNEINASTSVGLLIFLDGYNNATTTKGYLNFQCIILLRLF